MSINQFPFAVYRDTNPPGTGGGNPAGNQKVEDDLQAKLETERAERQKERDARLRAEGELNALKAQPKPDTKPENNINPFEENLKGVIEKFPDMSDENKTLVTAIMSSMADATNKRVQTIQKESDEKIAALQGDVGRKTIDSAQELFLLQKFPDPAERDKAREAMGDNFTKIKSAAEAMSTGDMSGMNEILLKLTGQTALPATGDGEPKPPAPGVKTGADDEGKPSGKDEKGKIVPIKGDIDYGDPTKGIPGDSDEVIVAKLANEIFENTNVVSGW